jgi:hypothetical protein
VPADAGEVGPHPVEPGLRGALRVVRKATFRT